MMEKEQVLTCVSGLLHFYGILDFTTLAQALGGILEEPVDADSLKKLLTQAAADEDNPYLFEEWQGYYCDYCVGDPEWVLEEQQRRKTLPYRPVTVEEAVCVLEDRYTTLWNEGERRFYTWLLEKSGTEAGVALGLMLEYQDCLKNDMQPMDLIMTVVQALNIRLDEVEEVARVMMEFADHVPLWILKGWSPAEVRTRFRNS